MKKTILFSLVLLVAFTLALPVYADTTISSEGINVPTSVKDTVLPASTSGCTLYFTKLSSTSAEGHASATRPNVTSITSTIRLQKKSGSSYVNTTQYATKTVQKTYISHTKTFTINSSNTYRIKVTIKYVENGTTYSNIYYKTLS